MITERIPYQLVTGDRWGKKITLSPFVYIDELMGTIDIPAGFIFDGASIPRIAWSWLGVTPFSPKIIGAAVIHDWAYQTKVLSRKDADDVFKRMMDHQGMLGKGQKRAIYRAVRLFGGKPYKRLSPDDDFLCPQAVIHYIRCNHG